jgi:peptide/nickel transport system substrate-binding protein
LAYDTKLAGEYLDKAGLNRKDAEGFRLGPDGKRFVFTFEIDSGRSEFIDMSQLLQGYLKAVGIDAQVRTMDRSLWEVRVRQNAEFDATIHRFGGGIGQAALLDPRYYLPFSGNSFFAPAWQTWYNNPSGTGSRYKPEEPPEQVKQALRLYDQVNATGDLKKQVELMQQILAIAADQFYAIGITTGAEGYGIVRNNFRNVPLRMPWSWDYAHPAPENPSQFFLDKSVK